ncbi:hypothetical protein ZWY2020_003509 [Hordeum vulgare]|nr:hypothetical protein ZWY2020_003509 [Hordeum vulgare]
MRVVHRCTSRSTEEAFAVKSVDRSNLVDDLDRGLAKIEPKVAQLVVMGNRGVVQVHAVYEDESWNDMVMDLCSDSLLVPLHVGRRGRQAGEGVDCARRGGTLDNGGGARADGGERHVGGGGRPDVAGEDGADGALAPAEVLMSRFTASLESTVAEGPVAPRGGATALMLTVARCGCNGSSELSAGRCRAGRRRARRSWEAALREFVHQVFDRM